MLLYVKNGCTDSCVLHKIKKNIRRERKQEPNRIITCNVVKLYFFTFLVPCCDVRYDFRVKTMFDWPLLPFVMKEAHVLCMFFCVFIYVHWCPPCFPYQMMFVSLNSGVRFTRSLVLCVCFVDRCLSFFFLLAIVLSVFDIRILITLLVSSKIRIRNSEKDR